MVQGKRGISVRHRRYQYPPELVLNYDSGHLYLTAEWNALAMVIPSGEKFFIRSVRPYLSKIKDSVLQSQLKAFVGQEMAHSQETQRCIQALEKIEFPIREYQEWLEHFIGKWESWVHWWPSGRLAATAGLEHYTAALAQWHLDNGYCDRFPDGYKDYWQWHAAEELEHKSVAFNLLQEVAPRNYFTRILWFIVIMALTFVSYRKALKLLLRFSGLSKKEIKMERKHARKVRIPILSWRFPSLLKYLKPGFHPDNENTDELIAKFFTQERRTLG